MTEVAAPATRRRRGRLAVAVLVVVLVAAGVGVWSLGRDGGHHQAGAAAGAGTGRRGDLGSASTATAGAGVAGDVLRWVDAGSGLRLPTSRLHGPATRSPVRVGGWTHDELGAVLAAAWLDYRTSALPGPNVYRVAITTQGVGDPDAALSEVDANYTARASAAGIAYGQPLTGPPTRLLGYQITGSPAGDQVTVSLCAQVTTPTTGTAIYLGHDVLTWQAGDWHIHVPLDDPTPIDSTAGCTPLLGA